MNPNHKSTIKRTTIAAAVATAIGATAIPQTSMADIYVFSYGSSNSATFTMLTSVGDALLNPDRAGAPWYQGRTAIAGTLTFDTATDTGSLTMSSFSFFGGGAASATSIALVGIGDGFGNPGNLLLGNMGFNWSGNNGIPLSIVFDAQGLSAAISLNEDGNPANNLNTTTNNLVTGGALSASETTTFGSTMNNYTLPLGPGPLVTTTWDTSNIGQPTLGTNPSGTLPLIADTIAGSPFQQATPFNGFNGTFDFQNFVLTSYTDTTPPVLTLNGPSTVNLTVGATYTEQGATCVDGHDGTLTPVIDASAVNTAVAGNYVVTYNCADTAATPNAATQLTRTVSVTAAGTPSITLLGVTPVNHELCTTYTDAGATCDDGAGNPISPLNGTFTAPENFSSDIATALDVNVPGSQTISYSCTNAAGTAAPGVSRIVNVQDTTPPVITLTPNCDTGANAISVLADGVSDPTPTATANDPNCGVDLTASITKTGDTVNPNPAFGTALSQTFNLGFGVTDAAGNSATPKACKITLGNPNPVATLRGAATVSLRSGQGFTDLGASCADFTDGTLPDATISQSLPAGTPDGVYTITYTCTNLAGKTGTVTRPVTIGAAFAADEFSGSNFTMITPDGNFVGGATDIIFSWIDGQLYNNPADPAQQTPNATMSSAAPQPFFNAPWIAKNIRIFGPGSYTFDSCPAPVNTTTGVAADGSTNCVESDGSVSPPLTMVVGENQIGAHMLFDWNGSNEIDVALVWDINGVFQGPRDGGNGANDVRFDLVSVDPAVGGDGISGIPMRDGPFKGFHANFNIKMNLTPSFALPDASASAQQGANNPASVIASTTDVVTVTASVNPNVNGVITYAGPFTYDWSTSDAALLAVNGNGTTSSTFTFNPSTLPAGPVTARVKVTDGQTGLTSTVEVPLSVVAGALTDPAVQDSDGDGIPDAQDLVDNTATPTTQQAKASSGTNFLLQSSAGTLVLGELASRTGAQTGTYQVGVTETDIGTPDNLVAGSCVGGCFSFKVNGLANGAPVDVVLPLSQAIPSPAGFRKFINGQWRDFDTTNGNALMSSAGTLGNCPPPNDASWTAGLTSGDFCVKLTIVDGDANDADGLANGTVEDPGGVSGAGLSTAVVPATVEDPSNGGCTLAEGVVKSGSRADWWLVAGFLGMLGWFRRKVRRS